MATIYIPKTFSELAERLARRPVGPSQRPIFKSYMELMVFAAMVGYRHGNQKDLDSKERGSEVYEEVFERAERDGLVYLLALNKEKSAEVLREKEEVKAWRIFESYAAAGLNIIENWLLDRPGDADGVETLLARMTDAASDWNNGSGALKPDIDF